jgi:hypothetical protein
MNAKEDERPSNKQSFNQNKVIWDFQPTRKQEEYWNDDL